MTNRHNEVLNRNGQSVSLPSIQKNYGVSSDPVKKAAVLNSIVAVFITVGIIALNLPYLIVALLIPVAAMVYVYFAQDYRINSYRDKYFLTVLSPWFKDNFGYQLHTFDIKRFMDGIAIIATNNLDKDEEVHIFARYDTEKDEIYVSNAVGQEGLNELTDYAGVRYSSPRVSPFVRSKGKEGYIDEAGYFKSVDTGTDAGFFIVAYSATSDGNSSSDGGSSDSDSGGGDGGGGGGD
jgi:uncharacterized membrane protein YgcG